MADSVGCLILLLVLASIATGVPCLFYGYKCKNAELRAQHKTDHCKDIHDDASAIALIVFGWIFSIPWLLALTYLISKCKSSVSVSSETAEADGGDEDTCFDCCLCC